MNNKKSILILMAAVSIVSISLLTISLVVRKPTSTNDTVEKGDLQLNDDNSPAFVNSPGEEILKADEDYYAKRENHISIVDPENILSQDGFLPTKAHFIRNEKISEFLNESGYNCEEVEVTTIKQPYKKDNNSTFYCSIPEYDDILLECTWYGMTEEFKFSIIAY